MGYCFNIGETEQFVLDYLLSRRLNGELLKYLKMCENWEISVHIISYFFTIVLSGMKKRGDYKSELIEILYQKKEEMYITIQDLDGYFVEYMMRNVNEYESMEEMLVQIELGYSQRNYTKSI